MIAAYITQLVGVCKAGKHAKPFKAAIIPAVIIMLAYFVIFYLEAADVRSMNPTLSAISRLVSGISFIIMNIFVFKGFTFRNFFTIIIFLILPAAAGITSLMFFIKKITPMKIAAMACVGVLLLAIIIQDIVITVRSHYYWDILFMFVAIITYGSIIASIAVTGSVPDVKPAPQQYYPPQGYAPQQGYMQQPNYAQPQQDYSNYNSFNQQ